MMNLTSPCSVRVKTAQEKNDLFSLLCFMFCFSIGIGIGIGSQRFEFYGSRLVVLLCRWSATTTKVSEREQIFGQRREVWSTLCTTAHS